MISVTRPLASALGALCVFSCTSLARAQHEPYEELTVKHYPERVLGGHTFMTPALFPTAFVATTFSLRQGVVLAQIPDFPLSQSTRLDVKMLGQNERLKAALRVLDPLQLFVVASAEAYVGSNVESVLVGGSSFSYTVGGGAMLRIVRVAATGTQLSVRAQGTYGPGGVLDLLRLVDAIIERDPEAASQVLEQNNLRELVLRDTERTEGALEILIAQSFTRHFGLQGVLRGAYTRSSLTFFDTTSGRDVTTDTNKFSPEAAVAFGANLDPLVPLGFLAEYSIRGGRRSLPGSEVVDTQLSHALAIGANLVHPQFQLGLTFAETLSIEPITRLDPSGVQRSSGKPTLSAGQLSLEFTWW